MSNTINWGKIYEKTAWGIGVVTNTISWGKIYANLAGSIPSFALDFANIANDFTFTRSSFATRVNEQGLIETVTDLGSELIANGDWYSHRGAYFQITNDLIYIENDGNTYGGIEQSFSVSSGKNFQLKYNAIKGTTSTDWRIFIGSSQGGADLYSKGQVSDFTENTIITSTSSEIWIRVYNNTPNIGDNFSIDNISVREVLEDDVPRIDYSDATFDVPVLGNELIVNGSFDTDSDWNKGASWSIADGKATSDGSVNSFLTQNSVLEDGKTYSVSFEISGLTSGSLQLRFGSGATITKSYNSNQTVSETFTSNGTSLNFYSVSGFDGSIDNVSVKEVTAYTTTDKGAFLLEPQSTNLLLYSEDFSQWNAISNPTVTLNQAISPDGTNNATLLEFDQTVTTSRIEVSIPSGGGGDWVFSIWAKSVSGNDVSFGMEIGSAGTLEQERVATSEWKRFYIVGTTTSSVNLYPQIEAWTTNNESIYIWGGQLEALPYATSYIPTNGSSVTRSAESCVDATPTINSEEGTLYAEISALADSNDLRLIELNDKTALNRVLFYYRSNDRISFNITINNVNVLSKNISSANVTDTHKLALLWSQDNFSAWVDGVKVSTITSGNTFAPNTLTDLDFSDPFGNLNFYGNTKDLKIYDKALTDDELIELTTI